MWLTGCLGSLLQVSTASQQQLRQLALQKQLITPQRKLAGTPTALAQVAGKRVPAQLSAVQIVPAQKPLPTTVTVQQIQQVVGRDVIKVPPTAVAGARGSASQLQARVLPAGQHHPVRQTIQVVSGAAPRPLAALQSPRPAAPAAAGSLQLLQTSAAGSSGVGSSQASQPQVSPGTAAGQTTYTHRVAESGLPSCHDGSRVAQCCFCMIYFKYITLSMY